MRDFSKVSPAVWQSHRFNSLPADDGRYLYLYLLTSSHQNSAGCYWLPDAYASADLRWPPTRYAAARQLLVEADLIRFDGDASVVLITRWFRHNPPMSESHLTGIERVLERISSNSLREAAQEALQKSWQSIEAEKVAKAQRKPKPANGPSHGIGRAPSERLNTGYLRGSR